MKNAIDITLSRTFTINTGNYQSIKPCVSITLKDADVGKLDEIYGNLQTIVNGLVKFETVECSEEIELVNAFGLKKHCEQILKDADDIGAKIEVAMSNIRGL